MKIEELRRLALDAVDSAVFSSSLPAGEIDPAAILPFFHRRREEIVTTARGALNDHASVLHPEVILRLLYGEVSEEEFAALTTA